MKVSRYLSRKRIALIDAFSKEAAIEAVLDLFQGCTNIADHELLRSGIWTREGVLPTGLGMGIGVPHVRCKAVRDPIAALGVLKNPVDYGSIDGQPVSIILVVAMPEGMHMKYLEYMAKVTAYMQTPGFRAKLLACDTADEVWEVVSEI